MITDKAEVAELLSELCYTCAAVIVDRDAVTYPKAIYPAEGGDLEAIECDWIDAKFQDCHERIEVARVRGIEMLPGGKEIRVHEDIGGKVVQTTILCFLAPIPPKEATPAQVVKRAEELYGDELWATTGEVTAQALFDAKRELEGMPCKT